MKRYLWIFSGSATAALLLLLLPQVASAQQGEVTQAPNPALAAQKQQQEQKAKREERLKEAEAAPTPRLADGHPDLNGRWTGAGGNGEGGYTVFKDNNGVIHADRVERTFSTSDADQEKNGASYHYFDQLHYNERIANDPNKPPYKPEFMAKVKDLDIHENQIDPHILCHPDGPREGPPGRIIQADGTVVFLYANGENGDFWRIIPTDGRPHRTDLDDSYFGDSVGRWEGDTLIIDTIGFNDDTWLGSAGWFHSTALHEIERITRKGNVLTYQATFEDPKVWTRSWVKPPNTLVLNTDREAEIAETAPCENRDIGHLVNHDHF